MRKLAKTLIIISLGFVFGFAVVEYHGNATLDGMNAPAHNDVDFQVNIVGNGNTHLLNLTLTKGYAVAVNKITINDHTGKECSYTREDWLATCWPPVASSDDPATTKEFYNNCRAAAEQEWPAKLQVGDEIEVPMVMDATAAQFGNTADTEKGGDCGLILTRVEIDTNVMNFAYGPPQGAEPHLYTELNPKH